MAFLFVKMGKKLLVVETFCYSIVHTGYKKPLSQIITEISLNHQNTNHINNVV